MKKIYAIFLSAALAASACEEFQPVFTLKYDNPEPERIYTDADFPEITPIKEFAKRYNYGSERAVLIQNDVVISGKVITDDRPGNFYKSLYIQDETGAIEIKMGRNGLYNEYRPGQTIYVNCNGLYLGMYGYNEDGAGMLQVGHEDPTGEYETSYLESALIVDTHVFKGETGDVPAAVELTQDLYPSNEATAANNALVGTKVTLKGLKYDDEVFVLMYLNSNLNKDDATNRIFLSGKSWGVTSWAMSKNKMNAYLESGIWDNARVGSGKNQYEKVGEHRVMVDTDEDGVADKATYPTIEKAAYSVSQYFKTPWGKKVIIRTSGYSKFGDTEIGPAVLSGEATIDATGILSMYRGEVQLILIDMDGIKVNK